MRGILTGVIEGFINKRRFVRDGEERQETFNCLANYMLATGHQVTTSNLDIAIGNILNSPQGRWGYLRFGQTPDELKHAKEREQASASTPVRKVTQEERNAAVSHLHGMGGPERSRPYKPVNANTPTRQEPIQPSDEGSYWSGRVRDFLANIPSNIIRAEAENLYGHINNGSWYATYRMLEGWYDRRRVESTMAGRMG